ncbi:hypothetical protein N7481_013057 [Penicillium waksmanii]|uniref:uncharacterized protein n=1 Tax=Penicillium waksmanii TaxID=69791 RepID=UPI0025490119|nr:uncharacterized protein N7481_013057 [Penicillium waksmanii]KAJ5966343.1 hypothetical protein N7481_013057 [Penicillium waksmanii]
MISYCSDIDGQSERCHVRIEEGIMPIIFEKRLEMYEGLKKRQYNICLKEKKKETSSNILIFSDMLASEPGLSWEVVLRLESLKSIKEELIGSEDPTGQLPNVDAIIAAYRSGELNWRPGYVTFWSKGKKLGPAKKFDVDDSLKVNRKHDGHRGFWVEGRDGLEPARSNIACELLAMYPYAFEHEITLDIRIPGSTIRQPLYFLDDTGASHTHIFQEDLDLLHIQDPGHQAPGLGWSVLNTSNGDMRAPGVLLEAALFTDQNVQLIPWTRVNVMLYKGNQSHPQDYRLSGIWWRHMIGVASFPDNTGRLHLGTERRDFDNLPDFDRDRDAVAPEISYNPPSAAPPAPPLPPPLSTSTQSWASGDWALNPSTTQTRAPAATGPAERSHRRRFRDSAARGLRKLFR